MCENFRIEMVYSGPLNWDSSLANPQLKCVLNTAD